MKGAELISAARGGSTAGDCPWPQSRGGSWAAPDATVASTATFASNVATAAVGNLAEHKNKSNSTLSTFQSRQAKKFQ